jgi:hypothetical protein
MSWIQYVSMRSNEICSPIGLHCPSSMWFLWFDVILSLLFASLSNGNVISYLCSDDWYCERIYVVYRQGSFMLIKMYRCGYLRKYVCHISGIKGKSES